MKELFTFFGIFLSVLLFSQSNSDKLIKFTSDAYGVDDILVNGSLYTYSHPVAFGDPFLMGDLFRKGSLFLRGRNFEDVLIKFDVESQKLVLKAYTDSVSYEVIVLSDNYIKAFDIEGLFFVNISYFLDNTKLQGFYELIYSGDIHFVRSYEKEFLATYSSRYPRGKYSETKSSNFIILNEEKYKIKSKGDLFKLFPLGKQEIKKFIAQNKIKFRKASNKDFNKLMQYCDEVNKN